ncbi:MAG TPA: hypothetical protein VF290_08475 [Pyrinomonadaceae bacterium]
MKTKEQFSKTNLESFRKLRSLAVDDPEWFRVRNQICEENQGLAYYVVHREGSGLLNKLTGGTRDALLDDLRQLAVTELLRVITVFDPERTHSNDPDKHVEFATFAYKNLLFKVRDHCKATAERLELDVSLTNSDDEDEGASISDTLPAGPSSEAKAQEEKETRQHYFTLICDPSLEPRLTSILNKLKYGDSVTLFERQFLFKLIADPNIVLSPREHAGSEDFMLSKTHEPMPLRRYRSWRQILS